MADSRYENGSQAQLLDVIRIQFIEARPHGFQKENHLIDAKVYWQKLARASWTEIESCLDKMPTRLWLNGYSSTYGVNDQVPERLAQQFDRSLYLLRPGELSLVVGNEGGGRIPIRRRVRAHFEIGGNEYRLMVTDSEIERLYRAKPEGEYGVRDGILCISLGEPYRGHAYKLAAAVITRDRVRR